MGGEKRGACHHRDTHQRHQRTYFQGVTRDYLHFRHVKTKNEGFLHKIAKRRNNDRRSLVSRRVHSTPDLLAGQKRHPLNLPLFHKQLRTKNRGER